MVFPLTGLNSVKLVNAGMLGPCTDAALIGRDAHGYKEKSLFETAVGSGDGTQASVRHTSGALFTFSRIILGEISHLQPRHAAPCLPLRAGLLDLRLGAPVKQVEDPLETGHVLPLRTMQKEQKLGRNRVGRSG